LQAKYQMPNTGRENTRPETKPDLHNTFHIAVPVAKKKSQVRDSDTPRPPSSCGWFHIFLSLCATKNPSIHIWLP